LFKTPNAPNPKIAELIADALAATAEVLEPGAARRVAGKLGRTPVEAIGKTALNNE
jgi:hypothetical protein